MKRYDFDMGDPLHDDGEPPSMIESKTGYWVKYEDVKRISDTPILSAVPSDNEMKLRKLLWLNHGCPRHRLYGDDGEMQCSQCGLDFKRETADALERGIAG